MENFINPISAKASSKNDYHTVRRLFRDKYVNAWFSFISEDDGLSEQEKETVYKEVWCLLRFLTAPESHVWMKKTKIWRDATYRKNRLAAFYIQRPKSKKKLEQYILDYHYLFNDIGRNTNNEGSTVELYELPPIEPMGDK